MSPKRALVLFLLLAAAATAVFLFNQDSVVDPLDPTNVGIESGVDAAEGADTQKGNTDQSSSAGEIREAVAGREKSGPSGERADAVALRGRLVGADGAGIAVEIAYRDNRFGPGGIPLPPGLGLGDPVAPTKARSGTDGRFEFHVQPGRAGILTIEGEELVLAKATAGRGLLVNVEAADTDLGDLPVVAAATIAGQVVAGGSGVGGVEIVVGRNPVPVIAGRFNDRNIKTDADGRFTIRGIVPGSIRLDTRSPDYLPAQHAVEVAAGQNKTDVLIKLRQGGVITGTVVDDLGHPIEDATVSAARSRKLSPQIEFSGYSAGESTKTNAGGQFRLAGLSEPAVEIRSHKKGFVAGRVRRAKAGTSNLVVKMERLGRITGTLVDEKGDAIVGSDVSALVPQGGMRFEQPAGSRTDAEGKFAIDAVKPGRNVVTAAGEDHIEATQSVEVRPGETSEGVRITARRGSTLTVTVLDEKGRPVVGAEVTVATPGNQGNSGWHGAGNATARRTIRREVRRESRNGRTITRILGESEELGKAETDVNGVAVIRGLAAGSVEFKATHESLSLLDPGETEIPDAGAVAAQLHMRRGGFANIHVVDTSGHDLGNRAFFVVGPLIAGEDNPVRNKHNADAKAVARVGPLAPGRYQAMLEQGPAIRSISPGMSFSLLGNQSGLEDSKTSFVVVADEVTEVELVMPVLTTVSGSVRDAEGLVEGAEVELLEEGQIRMPMIGKFKTRTDAEGHFEIQGMPSGKYTLSFNRRGAVVPAEKDLVLAKNQPTHEEHLTLPGAVVKLQVKDGVEGFGVEDAKVSLRRYVAPTPGGQPPRRRQMVMIGISMDTGGRGPSTFRMSSSDGGIKTDAKGYAEIPGVPSGKYTLTIEHTEYAKVTQVVQVVADQLKNLGVVRVVAGCKVRGRVAFGEKQSMNMCAVEIRDDAGARDTVFSQDGNFRFSGLKAGTYKLRAQAVGSNDWGPDKTVEVTPGRSPRVALTLPKPK